MLSTENPPVDLSCSSSSPIISKICSDEKGSNPSNQQLHLKFDLSKSSLDENKKQVSNFSIRDYVFCTRDKDIKTHWPFSPNNLQLCLKHGISNVLPPFQKPYSVKNPSAVDSEAQEFPETTTIPTSNKVVRNSQNPVKNCKLIVKPGTEPKPSKEPMKTTVVADTMASKICPVCKTFSSSSNTTLNAHIDQCLSGGPASNSIASSKVIIKHRIKPRKIKLMVDIYKTALHCTLEDLDRRNGTNWASSSNPAKDLEETLSPTPLDNEENNEMFSYANVADKDVEGAVYVDSTGTKLRILSKFRDLPSNAKSIDDHSPKKLVKGGKGYKLLSSKKKYLHQKRKLLKSSSHVKILDHCSKASDDEQKHVTSTEGLRKCDLRRPLELRDRMKSDDLGIVKKWVVSKRTTPKMKNNNHKVAMETSNGMKRLSPPSSDKITSLSAESLKRKKNLSYHSPDECAEQSLFLRKRTEKNDHGKKSPRSLSKCKDLQKDGISEYKYCSRDRVSSSGDKQKRANMSPLVRMSRHQAFSSGTKGLASQKSPSLDHKILPHDNKFTSSKENLQSGIRLAPVSGAKRSTEMKHLKLKKRKLRYASESDEEAIVPRSAICRQDELFDDEDLGEDASPRDRLSDKPSNDRFRDLKVQKNRLGYANSGLRNSLGSMGHCVGTNSDSYVRNDVATHTLNTQDSVKEVEIHQELSCQPSSGVVEEQDLIAFEKYLHSPLPPYAECVPRQYVKAGDEVNTRSGLVLIDGKETFTMDNGKHLIISNNDSVIENDANEDYYANIDPIPIPGPPGSFLPSPGRMGSDELQGSSSLTTCKIHSSEEDEREVVVDLDSSDSPISATSFVSNSIVNGSDTFKHRSGVHDEIQRDFVDANIYRAAAESSSQFDTTREEQRKESRANVIVSEMSPHGLIKNGQPCCCSRKDGAFQHNLLDCEEPQVLGQRTLNSISLHPAQEKQISMDRFNSISEVLNVKVQHTSEPNKVVTNFSKDSHNESPSPSCPNPVLRLMGKNLMVVNKEENFSPEIRPTTQAVANGHLYSRSFSDKGLSDKNAQYRQSSYNTALPSVLNNGSQTTIHAIEFGAPDVFRMHEGFRKPALFPQKSFNGSFAYREYAAGLLGPARDPEKVTNPEDLIIVDGSPENEAGLAGKALDHHVDIVHSMPSNPFYVYTAQNHQLYSGAQEMVQKTYHTQVPYSMGIMQENNIEKWKRATAESSRMLLSPISFTASSSLPGRVRSSPYTSHGFPSDEKFS